MSRRIVVSCDVCGVDVPEPFQASFEVGTSSDAAGGPSRVDHEDFDLCVHCTAFAFRLLKERAKISYQDGVWIAARIKERAAEKRRASGK